MISVIRKYQKSLMVVVAFLTIIAFAFLYNPADPTELGGNIAARVYGKTYTQADVDRIVRGYQLALALGQLDLLQGLGATAPDQDRAVSDYIWNVIVLRHEAKKLGIQPTENQIADAIRAMPPFQNNGAFDPARYEEFVTSQLGPRGLTPFSIEEVATDALRLTALQELIGVGATVSPAEVERALRYFEAADIQIFRFSLEEFEGSIAVSEDDVRAYFDRNSGVFVAPETVTIQAAKFSLGAEARELEGRARVAALQEVAGEAATFAEAGGGGDFEGRAKEAGAEFLSVGPFARGATDAGIPAAVVSQSFLLPADTPTSEVVQDGDQFYVFRVLERKAERPLTFAEAAAAARARLVRIESAKALRERAETSIGIMRGELASGKSLQDAALAAGLRGEEFVGVEPAQPALPPELNPALRAVPMLDPGQISSFIPNSEGGLAVAVISRAAAPPNPEIRGDISARILESKQGLFFASWLNARREASGLVLPSRRQ
jgi:parvulin-like peptidyl-prolyl isomerase